MSMCRVIASCVVGMTSAFSWQNSVSLCPASFYTPKPNLPVTPYLLTSYFYILAPYDEKDIFFSVLVLEGLQSHCRTGISGWGIDLDYCDSEWFALEPNRYHFVIFEISLEYCISDSFLDCEGYSVPSKGFFYTVVDIMVISSKFSHSSPF